METLQPCEPKNVVIKIDYTDSLTPDQVAVFYNGLREVLNELDEHKVVFEIEKGSLKTVIAHGTFALATTLSTAYLIPNTPTQISNAFNFTKSFNNNNFSLISIDNRNIYTKDDIGQKHEKFKELQASSLIENTKEEVKVETLEMIITSQKVIEIEETKTGKEVKIRKKVEFTARFNDIRYGEKYEIKVISKNLEEIENLKDNRYYFIADGTLHKSGNKYTKFEISNMVKEPTMIEVESLEMQFDNEQNLPS